MSKKSALTIGMIVASFLLGVGTIWPVLAQTQEPPKPVKPVFQDEEQPAFLHVVETNGQASNNHVPVPEAPEDFYQWQRVVFQSYRDGNWEIYSMSDLVSDPINLTNFPSSEARPRINHDATRIVFNSNRNGWADIYVMNFDGSGLTRLTTHESSDYAAAWSPDGDKIAFVSNRDGNSVNSPGEIYVMNADGSNQTRITHDGLTNDNPIWSPDGIQIAWVRYNGAYSAIWVMNADGSNPHALTVELPYLGHPAWSPDGTQMAFDYDADGDVWNELVVMNLDGTGLHIVYNPDGTYREPWMGSWSQNGYYLIFSLINYVEYAGELYLLSSYVEYTTATGGLIGPITSSGYDMNPDWTSLDTLPPISQVNPLPVYSRASGFEISWWGIDQGPAGLNATWSTPYEIEYRLGISGDWANIFGNSGATTNGTTYSFSNPTCDVVYFRSRARDAADNWEDWPPGDGDSWSKLFYWLISGSVKDSRGYVVPNSPVTIFPASWEADVNTDIFGNYLAHLPGKDEHTLAANHTGYNSWQQQTIAVVGDTSANVFLRPADNILFNGGFEAENQEFTHWITSGTLSATIVAGYSGANAAILGMNCNGGICLTASEMPYEADIYSYPTLVVDHNNNPHIIWDRLMYSTRDSEGNWSTPYPIANIASTGYVNDYKPAMAIDPQDTIHVMIAGSDGLYYLQKPAGGAWSMPERMTSSLTGNRRLEVDNSGNLHIVYSASSERGQRILYIKRLAAGIWESPIPIDIENDEEGFNIAIDADGIVHFVYEKGMNYPNIMYRSLLPDGTLTPPEKIWTSTSYYSTEGAPIIGVDSSNTIHIVGGGPEELAYISGDNKGNWSNPLIFPQSLYTIDMVVEINGSVNVTGMAGSNSLGNIIYFHKAPHNHFFKVSMVPTGVTSLQDVSLGVDIQGKAHIVWANLSSLVYCKTATASQVDNASISQTIPMSELHQPTLDFMYRLDDDAMWTNSSFDVSVTAGLSTTQVFSTTAGDTWSHVWADLSPWAGQTVTLTFALHQAAGEPFVHLCLDDISLGSWLTPIISDVTPDHLDAWTSAVITITGNFVTTPTIKLNDITLTGVEWIDASTLRITLHEGLPPDVYTIRIINPGGQEAIAVRRLMVGYPIFMPIITKNAVP